jgi:uncharacterized protein YegP (UPF0339 family)
MQFQTYKTIEGLLGVVQWRWRLVAGNGRIIASGEGYNNKVDCEAAVRLVMDTSQKTPWVEVAA